MGANDKAAATYHPNVAPDAPDSDDREALIETIKAARNAYERARLDWIFADDPERVRHPGDEKVWLADALIAAGWRLHA